MLLSPAGPVAQPEKSARRVQQQERVGVNVGSTEAHEDRVKAAVRDATVVRTSAHMHLYLVTFHSCPPLTQKHFLSFQHHRVHTCIINP